MKINFRYWGFTRLLRLSLAVAVTFQALVYNQYFLLIISAYLLYQVITNVGCATQIPKVKNYTLDETEFEEIN